MALIACKDCKKEFSTDSSRCPNCNARKPPGKSEKQATWLAAGIVCVFSIIYAASSDQTQDQQTQITSSSDPYVLSLLHCYSERYMRREEIQAMSNFSFLNSPTACQDEMNNLISSCENNGDTPERCQTEPAMLWLLTNAQKSPDGMIAGWEKAEDACRDASDSNMAEVICNVREKLAITLNAANWCYGKNGEAVYQMKWHRCTADSLKYEGPDN